MRRSFWWLLALSLAAAGPAEAAPPAVVNGGFESPQISGTAVFPTAASLAGWTVSAGSVTLADASTWAPASGAQSLQFNSPGLRAASAVRQSVAVTAGQHYRLSLSYADGPTVPPGLESCGSIAGLVMPVTVSWEGT